MHRLPRGGGQRQYHIACRRGDLAPYLLVPGDPERVPRIVGFWDSGKEVAWHREFRSWTGVYRGVRLSALSTGIGSAAMAIAVNEAAQVGVGTFIRVGSCGSIQRGVECGDLVISVGAVRLDGTSSSYVPVEFPAVASYEVVLALVEAAEGLGVRYHVGLTATASDFYAGQSRPVFRRGLLGAGAGVVEGLHKAGVLNVEMECAPLFVLASLFGLRAGAVCAVFANRVKDVFEAGAGEEDAIRVANEAVKILNDWDKVKRKTGKRCLFPSLLKK